MSEGLGKRIRHLEEAINSLDLQIAGEAEILKERYLKAAAAMPEEKNYFLNGLQAGSVVKSYLLTRKGIEVPGEATIGVAEFIDSILKFANHPKRKIQVLHDLVAHLQNIYAIIEPHEAQ